MTRKSEVQVGTAQYEFAHGKKPRGTGYWAFNFFNGSGYIVDTVFINGSYGAAKAAAVAQAAARDIDRIAVGS